MKSRIRSRSAYLRGSSHASGSSQLNATAASTAAVSRRASNLLPSSFQLLVSFDMARRGRKKKKVRGFEEGDALRMRDYGVGHSWFKDGKASAESAAGATSVTVTSDEGSSSDSETEDVAVVDVVESIDGVRLVEMPLLVSAIASFCVCTLCKSGTVRLGEATSLRQGLVSVCVLVCSACGHKMSFPLSSRPSPLKPYNTNIKASLAMRLIGSGHGELKIGRSLGWTGPDVGQSQLRASGLVLGS